MPSITLDLDKFFEAATAAYVRAALTDGRPIDRRVWGAEFIGFCKAADAMGIAMTPTHFQMTYIEAQRSMGTRPGYRAVNNEAMRDWDADMTVLVMNALNIND